MSQSARLETVKEAKHGTPSKTTSALHIEQVTKLQSLKQNSSKLYPTDYSASLADDSIDSTSKQALSINKIPCKEFVYEGERNTLGSRWETWLGRFKLFLAANKMEDEA